MFGDSRSVTDDTDDVENEIDTEEEDDETQPKSVHHETANLEVFITDNEFDSRAATFVVGEYKVRHVKTLKESMVRTAKFLPVVSEASKNFKAGTLNKKIM